MSDVAAHLVDEVLPEEPIRQWACSLPWSLRDALAYDRRLCADVLGAFLRAMARSLRRRAKVQPRRAPRGFAVPLVASPCPSWLS